MNLRFSVNAKSMSSELLRGVVEVWHHGCAAGQSQQLADDVFTSPKKRKKEKAAMYYLQSVNY